MRTDWVDDQFTGDRKYTMTDNGDSTYSFTDVTTYSQRGSAFGASQLNDMCGEYNDFVSDSTGVISISLSSSGWTESGGVYTQTVSNANIKSSMNPILVKANTGSMSASDRKAYNKAFAIIANGSGTTANGSVTFKVDSLPAITLTVGLKGV